MNDRKIKYVDLNGLKYFAEELKQYLKSHVLEFSIFNELKSRIEAVENQDFYKIVESYDNLPNPGLEKIIYLVPDNGDFVEYLWVGDRYEQLGTFTPQLSLDEYLKKEDSPFEKSEAEHSAVLKGGDNQVISEGSVALGKDNLVGLKGWYYKAISFNSSNGEIQLYLSKTQQVPKAVSSASQVEQEKDIAFPLSVGTIVSVVNDVKYDDKFKIERIDEIPTYGRIKLSRADGNKTLYFSGIKVETDFSPEDYSIYCLSEPTIGIVDLGQSSFVTGDNNKAINGKSVSFGINNTSWGKCAFTEGMSNEAGYAAHAEGKGNKAIGNHSHVEGQGNEALSTSSHAEGATNITYGPASHIEGKNNYIGQEDTTVVVEDTSTNGYASHAEGQANVVLGNSAHAEGIKNKVYDNGGHAEGRNNIVKGIYAHAEGRGNITNNEYEHASGKYNVSIPKTADNTTADATHFSIGIGTSENDTDRKNAFEVKQNGDIYIEGVEGRIQDKLNTSTSVTPDWNTINHSPVSYFDNLNCQFITMDNLQRLIIDDSFTRDHDGDVGVTYSKKFEEWVQFHFFHTLRDIQYGNKDGNGPLTYIGPVPYDGMNLSVWDNMDITLSFDSDTGVLSIVMAEYNEDWILELIRESVPLYYYIVDSDILTNYIPDSYLSNNIARSNEVVKTSRQTLSDTAKNQALTNLGIADLLEALKPVQLSGEPPIGTVTQEQLDEIGLTEKVINNIANGYTNKICIDGCTYYVTLAYKRGTDVEFVFARFYFNANGICNMLTQYTCTKNSLMINIEITEI